MSNANAVVAIFNTHADAENVIKEPQRGVGGTHHADREQGPSRSLYAGVAGCGSAHNRASQTKGKATNGKVSDSLNAFFGARVAM